jgi:DNA-binding PadR family transcriptional regulator
MLDDLFKNLHKEFHERIEEMQRSKGLRIWILHILDQHGPKNGVEIMDAVQAHHEDIHRRFRKDDVNHRHQRDHIHSKRPSPGSVYPMLKKMVDEGLIVKIEDGKYDLTGKGQDIIHKLFGHPFFKSHGEQIDRGALAIENALTEIDGYVSYLGDIKKEKLMPHEELINELSERFMKIRESLQEK